MEHSIDREKVIKGLEQAKDVIEQWIPMFEQYNTPAVIDCAIALLKEQEAVKPYQHDAVWLCGNCEKEVVGWDDDITGESIMYQFCRQCGRQVKWDA